MKKCPPPTDCPEVSVARGQPLSKVPPSYGLPTSVIPPYWHRHPELIWELSALHLHWLCAYDPEQNGSAPLG